MAKNQCSICVHKNRCAIDQAVTQGVSFRRIASQFKVGYKSVERHVKNGHVAADIQAAANDNQISRGKDLQQKIDEAYALALDAAKEAKNTDLRAFGGCIGGVMKALEIEAKVKGSEGKPPEVPKESGFMKGYMKRAGEVYAKDESPPG